MRIALVSQTFAPIRSGVAEAVYHEAVNLRELGHEVTVITSNFSRYDENKGLDVIRLGRDLTIPMNGAFVNLTMGLRLKHQLKQIEAEKKFDLAHIHSPIDPILPLLALNTLRAPKFGTFHSFVDGRSWGVELLKTYLRNSAEHLVGRIAVSEAAREFCQRYFPGEYRIIPNGVDINRFRPDLPRLPTMPEDKINILFVGRLDPRKGLRYLLKAFPQVHDRLPQTQLTVVGDGMLRDWYKQMLPQRYRPFVRYEGFVTAQDLPRYYSSADIYCSPATRGESFGIVLLEAMASGCPIAASSIRGYKTVMTNEVEGLMVPPRDSTALAIALIRLASDQQLRQNLGQTGLIKSKKYAWCEITKDIESFFQETLSN